MSSTGGKKICATQFKLAIEDALDTGLPRAYDKFLYEQKRSALFEHILKSYPERDAAVLGRLVGIGSPAKAPPDFVWLLRLFVAKKCRQQNPALVDMAEPNQFEPAAPSIFATTRWTVVLLARDASDDAGRAALEQLCRAYWRPLRSFALRAGHSPEDAEDFTQDFFVRLLARDALSNVSPEKGRFRNFLLVAFRNFLIDQREKARTAKRGGGIRPLSLFPADGDTGTFPEPADAATPEQSFERQWAHTLLQRARVRLRAEYAATDRLALYETLGPDDTHAAEESYEFLGARLGLSVPALKSAAFRLRKRYRELIRAEVADTVTSTNEVEEELRHLLRVLEA